MEKEKGILEGKKILIGITGSIAAYKIATLVSLLKKRKADVHVLMTNNATKFISPLTFESLTGNKVHTDTFDLSPDQSIHHISLVKNCDIFLIAPATANIIAKIVHGIADDMLTSTFIAYNGKKMVAPAMNCIMYENEINQDNLKLCKKYGMKVIEPDEGVLACGDSGKGRLPEPEFLLDEIIYEICYKKDLIGKKILVTAGPTQESLDPVRYITNHSSGKMGYSIAKVASNRGADVILVSGPVNIPVPNHVKIIKVISAKDMFEAVKKEYMKCDIIIKSAAVADYRPKTYSDNKLKKKDDELSIELERTDDILKYLGENKKEGQKLIGFSMETTDVEENSKKKLIKKNLDMIVANNLKDKGAGFGTDTNLVTIITNKGVKKLPLMSKEKVGDELLNEIVYNN
jgi:phosphopantothenoylcysteine decarboxylase/phosphopantothenate--cysteine ligase